eukprot:COSAG02_NODE_1170_length_14123_cov_9.614946_6_plen_166_part_00
MPNRGCRYEDSARCYGRWASEGLLAPAQLSSVLASYSEELMMAKAWAGNRWGFVHRGLDEHQFLSPLAGISKLAFPFLLTAGCVCMRESSKAMELATELVQQAVEADPEGDNIKAQLSFVAYALATAATPHEQFSALEHAEHLVSNPRYHCSVHFLIIISTYAIT